jgi:hypothetical protein
MTIFGVMGLSEFQKTTIGFASKVQRWTRHFWNPGPSWSLMLAEQAKDAFANSSMIRI